VNRLAIVVQRAGVDIVGGSEGYAYQMAQALSEKYKIDILTTCAKDYLTWSNSYKQGTESIGKNIDIIRFKNDIERDDYWHELNRVLEINGNCSWYSKLADKSSVRENIMQTPLGFCEEWIQKEGPFSLSLLKYIKENEYKYKKLIFMTYLYPTTYYGIQQVAQREKALLIPTFHDEIPAYLPIFQKYRNYTHLFLTKTEEKFATNYIYKERIKSHQIGFGLEDKYDTIPINDKNTNEDYIIYAGRLEENKGLVELYKYFKEFKDKHKSTLKLYTIGSGELKHANHPDIIHKGFVDEVHKLQLMKNALAFVHPSAFESLGIVLLEAFMMGAPAIVNNASEVLREHINSSKAGFCYDNSREFAKALEKIANNTDIDRVQLSENAREYYLHNYALDSFKKTLIDAIEGNIE